MGTVLGTVFSIVAIAAACTLSVVPPTSALVFYALGGLVVALAGAVLWRSAAGWFASATLLGWFSIMFAQPFSLTTQQTNQLARAARRDDEAAQALLDYYEALAPYSFWLMLALTAFVALAYVIGVRRDPTGAHRHMLDASNGLARFCTGVGVVAAVTLFAAMIFVIMYDVTQRQYLGFNPNWTQTAWYRTFTPSRLQEMEWHLHAALFLLCLGYGYVKDAHVRIELVRDTLRPRTRVWIELLGCALFMVPYCYVVMQYGIDNAVRSWNIGESSAAQTGLSHRFIIKGFLPLGFALIALAGLSVALKCVVYLFGPPSLRDEASFHAGANHVTMPPAARQQEA